MRKAAALAAVFSFAAAFALAQKKTAAPPPPSVTPAAIWKEVDRLVSDQKMEEASKKVAAIRAAARARGDADEETRALVREVQLRTALHGYETSVRFLKDQPWPQSLVPRTTLRLFYAQSLVTYAQAYSWEIGQRETVASKGAVDLKAWTRDEIRAEAVRAYVEVWKDREALGRLKVDAIADVL